MYPRFFNRLFDLIISILILVITSPFWIISLIALSLVNEGKPLFIQKRPGKNGQLFNIIKFKTMNDKKSNTGDLLPDDERLTPVGALIRTLSLDEIPQMVNVLKGDMSLVGPRPLLVEYLPLYNKEQARRHEVKPGITGWAQVNGRNTIRWQKKFAYDVFYVDHLSFVMDLKILLLTVKKVFRREGISSDTSVTMEKFKGN